MRRKSKKAREETKVDSSSERRSKRSSSRRKKTYDDDEGGSGVEEGRTTEEDINQGKGRSSRRYATRGRRQKVEESEEEESQNEEEGGECDEESSNTFPVIAEADDGDEPAADSDDDSGKEVKSAGGVADTASGEIDESSACHSDNQYWKMKAGKDGQDDKRGETIAHGEGDDGEDDVPKSHSRKKKLKLSRECLHENREAIPKIRLRLSRNRSGGYETEKVEAERIDGKAGGGESAVEVIKVETIPEGAEGTECVQSSEPSETVEAAPAESPPVEEVTKSEVAESEVVEPDSRQVVEPDSAQVVEPDSGQVVEPDSGQVVEPDSGLTGSGEMAEPDTEVDESKDVVGDKESSEEVIPDSINEKAEVKEEVLPQGNEGTDPSGVETVESTSSDSPPIVEATPVDHYEVSGEGEKVAETSEVTMVEVDDGSVAKEKVDASPLPVIETASEEEGRAVCEDEGGNEATEVKEEERRSEEEVGEVGNDQVSTSNEVEDAKKDGVGEQVTEGNVEVPVGGAEHVAAEGMEVEKGERDDKDAKEDEGSAVDEVPVSKGAENDSSEDKDGEGDKKSGDHSQNDGEEEGEVHRKEEESYHKGSGGERIGRINRSRLRQEDDRDEDGHSQKKRGRRKRSHSGGEDNSSINVVRLPAAVATTPPEQPQPKRVTLKRPKLNRITSLSSSKDKDTEEKDQPSEPTADGHESIENKEKEDEAVSEVSPENKEEVHEDATPEEPKSVTEDEGVKKRRRKWGQNKSQSGPSHSRRAFISISSQSLKGLIPEVKPLPIHELRLSIEKDDVKDIYMEEEESCDAIGDETIVRMIDTNGQSERTVWAQVVDDEMRPTVHPEVPRVPAVGGGDMNVSTGPVRRISIVSDDAVRLQRSPSPPRHPPSSILFLSNLVRPFTVQQLKELLARTGTVVEDGFWIDRIKSMCLVQYETEEQARETRHALHGVRWPISNPKRLWVDFSTKEKLEEAKREGNAPALPSASGPSLSPPHSSSRDDFPRKTEPLRMDGSGLAPTHPSHRGSPGQPGHVSGQGPASGGGQAREGDGDSVGWQQRGRPRPEPPPLRPGANARDFKMSAPVREWDLDKVVQQSPPRPGVHGPLHGGAVDDRRRPDAAGQPSGHRDRVMPSPPASMQDLQVRKAKRKEAEAAAAAAAEAPANLLDSLFRKTKATPSIYWLPLTADQIKVKEEIRRQHLAEHERRMAEMKRAAAKERAGRRRRRSSSPRRRSRRRSGGDDGGAVRKRPSESIKGRKAGSASPKK